LINQSRDARGRWPPGRRAGWGRGAL